MAASLRSTAASGCKVRPLDLQRALDSSAPITFTVTAAAIEGSLELLHAWLSGPLEIDRRPPLSGQPPTDLDQRSQTFLRAVSAVTTTLLNAVGIPFFRPFEISDARLSELGRREIELTIYPQAELPRSHYASAVEAATAVCRRALTTLINDATQLALQQHLEQSVLPGLRRGVVAATATVPLLRACSERGIPYLHLGRGIYRAGIGRRQRQLLSSIADDDSAIAAKIAQDKQVTGNLLRQVGLPAPEHLLVVNLAGAQRAAEELGWPLVVKPVNGERGEGVTVAIDNHDQLETAITTALAYSQPPMALVERQSSGICHRLFVANGELLYAVKRQPIAVCGNGSDTIASLAADAYAAEQRRPVWRRQTRPPLDEPARALLATLGLTADSVPAAGHWVPLRAIESTQWGGIDSDETAKLHPDNAALAVRAAAIVGLQTAGVDIIAEDLTVPWHQSGAVINEINYAPQFCGGEISRSYLDRFIDRHFAGGGLIPIEQYPASQLAAAEQRLDALHGQRLQVALLDGAQVRWGDGRSDLHSAGDTAAQLRALLLDHNLDQLLLIERD